MKKDFLLEILVQELPYKFIPSAIKQLEDAFKKLFDEFHLEYDEIEICATPRRLAVLAYNLNDSEQTITKDIKGPILSIAKDENGNYSPAAIGFAKKNNVDVSSLFEKDNYIYAHVEIKGKSIFDILKENVESIILKLQGPHFMRWGYNSEKFSRPIENVVAMFGDKIVDLTVLDKKSTNKTIGHRFAPNKELVIDDAKNYIDILKTGKVFVRQDTRKAMIVTQCLGCAQKEDLEFDSNKNLDELLEEITYITEWPVAVMCEFDKKYLQIPSIVTTTVMTCHQRYIPLFDSEGKLSNKFITMANYVGDDFSNIKAGNQRVICARLEDGVFFFEEDTKTKLIDKLDHLKGMTFQKGFGSLFDKTQRIINLADHIAQSLNIQDKTDLLRAAKLSKCDLATKLVFEFTELQGFIGQNYASIGGEKENVARAISEHYFPLNASSELPSDIIGQIISIADKIDTICALFISTKDNKKKRPTGSNDPLGARRAAIGILRIILEYNLNIDLKELIQYSIDLISKEFNIEKDESVLKDIEEFFISRLIFMFDKEIAIDTIKAIAKIYNPVLNLSDFVNKAKTIEQIKNESDFNNIKESAVRIKRILKDYNNTNVDSNLFVVEEEKELFKALSNLKCENDYRALISSLDSLIAPCQKFFENVLVMDENEKIKNNRLSLLALLNEKFEQVLDFSELQ